MTDPVRLTRRTLLGTAGLGAGLAMLPGVAEASSPGFRMLPETLTPTPLTPGPVVRAGLPAGWVQPLGDAVPRLRIKDGREVVHPTQLGNMLWSQLASAWGHPNRAQVAWVATVTEALMQQATRRQGARFLVYDFDWHAQEQVLSAPWHSAFGQSKFPKILYLLGKLTGEAKWARYRQEVMAAFRMPPIASQPDLPWIAGVDANNCLWLEEYPMRNGRFSTVFNGHFYALNELASYYALSKDPTAKDLPQGAAATMDYYRNLCRVPGDVSNYYANHRVGIPSYHHINISVYASLFNLTGAQRIGTLVDQMENDYPDTIDAAAAGQVRVLPGVHRIQRTVGSGAGRPFAWRPTTAMTLRTTSRHRWPNDPNTWLYMAEGPRRGFWVQESPSAYRIGMDTDLVEFSRSRAVTLHAGTIRGMAWQADGTSRVVRTATLPRATGATSRRRARLGGVQHLHIEDGTFAGLWVPEGTGANYR